MSKELSKETKDLIKDLLIYLDIRVNYERGVYLNNSYTDSFAIITEMQIKHPDFASAHNRQRLIKEMLEELDK